MTGLEIKTIAGEMIKVIGPVRYDADYQAYYCAGQSFPEELVTAIYGEEETACH